MASTDLFAEENYVIDTSSLVDIHQDEGDDPRIWEGIFRLIRAGRLCTVSYAFDELEDMVNSNKFPAETFKKLREVKRQFVISETEELTLEAGRIVYENPQIPGWRQKKNAADPWIIAFGKLNGWKVVSQERDTGPKTKRRIPWVCDQQKPKVKWIRLRHLIEAENFLA